MTQSLAAMLAIAACLALSACNTVRGAGHDIESVANTVDNAM